MKKIFTTCLLALSFPSFCQQQFTEGEIVYEVKIAAADAKEGKAGNGTLTILIKGNNVAKELNLNSGFTNKIIFNTNENSAYSLRTLDGTRYAIQLDAAQLKQKRDKCSDLHRQELESDQRQILKFATEKVKLTCNNASPVFVYYTRVWQINNQNVFQDFPTFNFLPLAYEVKREDGNMLSFELKKIEAKPIDNRVFTVPPDYKKISQKDYKSGEH